jgi:hypothetical protein
MSGALLQLVSYGALDIFLTTDPQITFFKTVLRRHTNFAIESIRQEFKTDVKFGKRVSLTVEKKGDLIGKTYLQIELPKVKPTQSGLGIPAEAIIENHTDIATFVLPITNGSGFLIDEEYTLIPTNPETQQGSNAIIKIVNINSLDVELINGGFNYQVGEVYNIIPINGGEPAEIMISAVDEDVCMSSIVITNQGSGYYFQPDVIITDCELDLTIKGKGIVENGVVVGVEIELPDECLSENVNVEIIGGQLVNTFAWCEKIGHAILNKIEIDIGGQIIDTHYGDWLDVWSELTIPLGKKKGYNKMIGNVAELYTEKISSDNDNCIGGRTLYIPLQFWFCRDYSLAIPQVALKNHAIKFNLELRRIDECIKKRTYFFATFNYIRLLDSFSAEVGDVITNGVLNASVEVFNLDEESGYIYFEYYDSRTNERYLENEVLTINGEEIMLTMKPIQVQNTLYNVPESLVVNLYTDIIYLDTNERNTFTNERVEYLIEQLQITSERQELDNYIYLEFSYDHICKELFWTARLQENLDRNSRYIYTTDEGESIFDTHQIEVIGYPLFKSRDSTYFGAMQPYQHHTATPTKGIFSYSFAIYPEETKPSGTLNMNRLDLTRMRYTIDVAKVKTNYQILFNLFGINYNIMRIENGMANILFNAN